MPPGSQRTALEHRRNARLIIGIGERRHHGCDGHRAGPVALAVDRRGKARWYRIRAQAVGDAGPRPLGWIAWGREYGAEQFYGQVVVGPVREDAQ